MIWDFYLTAKVGGVLVCIFFGGRAVSKAFGISATRGALINSLAAFAAFCGSRLWYILQNNAGAIANGQALTQSWNEAGSVLYGWILGATLALYFLCKEFKLPFVRYLDTVIPWMLIAQFLNRLGCYDAGCCYGVNMGGERLFPVQLVEGFYDLALFWYIRKKVRRPGETTFLYFTAYPVARFFFEFLRGDNGPALLFMTVPQVASIVILVVVYRLKNKILSPIKIS